MRQHCTTKGVGVRPSHARCSNSACLRGQGISLTRAPRPMTPLGAPKTCGAGPRLRTPSSIPSCWGKAVASDIFSSIRPKTLVDVGRGACFKKKTVRWLDSTTQPQEVTMSNASQQNHETPRRACFPILSTHPFAAMRHEFLGSPGGEDFFFFLRGSQPQHGEAMAQNCFFCFFEAPESGSHGGSHVNGPAV